MIVVCLLGEDLFLFFIYLWKTNLNCSIFLKNMEISRISMMKTKNDISSRSQTDTNVTKLSLYI